LARALTAAYNAHAQVVNLSLAGPDDPLVGDLIREGLRRGVLFVGAAEQADGLMHRAGVIEVASSGTQSPIASVLYAPGREILTLLPGGHYDFASGSSIATAQVSGVVALMLAKDPTLSAQTAYAVMRESSSGPAVASASTRSQGVDACAAVVAVAKQGHCRGAGEPVQTAAEAGEPHLALH
jgi:subtilisin family serine protease